MEETFKKFQKKLFEEKKMIKIKFFWQKIFIFFWGKIIARLIYLNYIIFILNIICS